MGKRVQDPGVLAGDGPPPTATTPYALYLTHDGARFMKELGTLGAAHEDDICAGLDTTERALLHDLLSRLAARQGLTAGVHPGYRTAAKP